MALTCQRSLLIGGLPKHHKEAQPDHYDLTLSVKHSINRIILYLLIIITSFIYKSLQSFLSELAVFECVQHTFAYCPSNTFILLCQCSPFLLLW